MLTPELYATVTTGIDAKDIENIHFDGRHAHIHLKGHTNPTELESGCDIVNRIKDYLITHPLLNDSRVPGHVIYTARMLSTDEFKYSAHIAQNERFHYANTELEAIIKLYDKQIDIA